MTSYSQSDEQEYIQKYFGDFKGRFLDIGAYDGKMFSNTHALALAGWSGVCIEPSVSCFRSLLQLYHTNDQVHCVNVALDTQSRIVQFYDSNGDAVSTTSLAHSQKWSIVGFKKLWIKTATINDIFGTFGNDYDMINLDVEGTNLAILKTIPLESMNVKLICIEYEDQVEEVIKYCKGYKELHRTNENIILVK